jgi:O-antigen/teichoic acid export membrane protein
VRSRVKQIVNSARTHTGFRRYAANTSWMFGEQMMRMVAGLLVGIWVAHYLGPEQFGLFSYATAFAALFGSIAKLGLDSIMVRDLVREPEMRDMYMGTAFWLKLIGAVAMLTVIGIALSFTSSDSTTKLYIFIIASGAIFQSFEVVDFYFQSKVLSKFVSICKLTQLIISSLLKLYLIYNGSGLLGFVLVSLFDQITLAVTLYLAYRHQNIVGFFGCFDRKLAKRLLSDSWPLIFSGLVVTIYMRIDQVMIKEMLGEKEVGLYSAAARISEVWYFIPVLLTNSLFPSILNAKKISNEFYYLRIQRLYSFLLWSAIAVATLVTFLSDHIVTNLFGQAYLEAGNILVIHVWAAIFVFLGVASSSWFTSEGLQKYSTINTAVGALVNVLLNLVLIPKYGVSGAAVATVISYAIAAYLMNFFFEATRSNFYRLSRSLVSFK